METISTQHFLQNTESTMIQTNITLSKTEVTSIVEQYSKRFTPPLQEKAEIQQYISKLSQYAHFAISREDDTTIGFVAYYINQDLRQLYITLIAVEQKYEGSGLAQRLMDSIRTEARTNKLTSVGLEVSKKNARAHNYYLRQGFIETQDRGNKWLMSMPL